MINLITLKEISIKFIKHFLGKKYVIKDLSILNKEDDYILVSFTGGLGAQLLSSAIYYDLIEKGYKVAADLNYFSKDEKTSVLLKNGLTHWNWQLDSFGIKKADFSTFVQKRVVYLPDGHLKSVLACNAFLNLNIKNKFKKLSFDDLTNKCLHEYNFILPKEYFICIHVRRGDYLNVASYIVPEAFFELISLKFKGIIETIIVFTDGELDQSFIRILNNNFSKVLLFENSCLDPFTTHTIMRHSKVFIGSNSQYSFTAGVLNDNLVIMPKIWFGKELDELNQQIIKLSDFVVLS
jgi:hypothetical protein